MTNQQFFRWNIVTNVCMALSINTTATILAGGDTVFGWITGCCCAFTVNTVAALLIPVGKIGKWFAETVCHQKPDTLGEFLSRNFIINAIYVTIVSLCMAMLHGGINGQMVSAWLSTYLQLHLTGLITAMVVEKPTRKLMEIWK